MVKAINDTAGPYPPYCQWGPCLEADNRPPTETLCPTGNKQYCIQIQRNVQYSGSGTVEHRSNCNMGTGTPDATETLNKALADALNKLPPPTTTAPPSTADNTMLWVAVAGVVLIVVLLLATGRKK